MRSATAGRPEPGPYADVNAAVGGYLRDLAFAQTDSHKMWGYKRAASAILRLHLPLTDLLSGHRLEKISGVGPASERIIREVLATGSSATVERAIEMAGKSDEIQRRRSLRCNFLSRAEVIRVLNDPTLDGPILREVHADLQMHSEWSDGSQSVADLRDACTERGYTFAAVTDHSYGLKIAGGMTMNEAEAQRRELDEANASAGGCMMLQGVEANIAADGTLDLTADEASSFDLVLAAPHSLLRKTIDQTARMVAAVNNPAVRILAHPRGRITGSRTGVLADWDEVFVAAAARGVAIELDGDPARQDLDFILARRAMDLGVLFALDSDAHTGDQLVYGETAVAHARLAGIPPDRIVNCWSLERFKNWLTHPEQRGRTF